MRQREPYRRILLPAVGALLVMTAAGCSDGGDGESTPSPSAGTVAVASTDLGESLVDGKGRTLYLFEADTGRTSTCSDACAKAWPPLTASGSLEPGDGVSGDLLGTTEREDGSRQVTYDGHPLYRYQEDGEPGDTDGQGLDQFGARWFVLNSSGEKVTREPEDPGGGY